MRSDPGQHCTWALHPHLCWGWNMDHSTFNGADLRRPSSSQSGASIRFRQVQKTRMMTLSTAEPVKAETRLVGRAAREAKFVEARSRLASFSEYDIFL